MYCIYACMYVCMFVCLSTHVGRYVCMHACPLVAHNFEPVFDIVWHLLSACASPSGDIHVSLASKLLQRICLLGLGICGVS